MKLRWKPEHGDGEVERVRQAFLRNLAVLVFVAFGGMIAIVLVSTHASVRNLSELTVAAAKERTEVEIDRFCNPIQRQLWLLSDWTRMGTLRLDDPIQLNALLIPILRSQSAATSVLIADAMGREHMLLKTSTGWLNRRINRGVEPRATHWEVLGPDGAVLDAYTKDSDYNSQSRPWFQAAQGAELNARRSIQAKLPRFFGRSVQRYGRGLW